MMSIVDPAFQIPSNKRMKKIIIEGYQNAVHELKKLITNTCETASLTTDLWTARSKHGYIGVTLHWLSSDFKVYDCLLCMERMPYPHSGENISTFLQEKVKEFNLEGKITCVVTDNGSNMVKAIKLWNGVERLPCAAHTLQLSINHAFKKSNTYIKRIKQLVKFFTKSPKQSEHLDRAQKECRYQNNNNDFDDSSDDNSDIEDNNENEDENNNNNNNDEPVLRNIVDVKTRWNSKYYSWQRLFKLRKAIE